MEAKPSRVTQFSDDERKTLILALAHLAHFLPQWDHELGRIAGKLDRPSLYRELKNLESKRQLQVAEESLRSA